MMRAASVRCALCLGLLLVVGCPRRSTIPAPSGGPPAIPAAGAPTPAPDTPPAAVPAQFVAARKTFDAACAKCHTIGGKGGIAGGPGPGGPGGPRPRGPDLGRVGAQHDRDWIVEHIRDPHTHKPNSRMPQFGV